MLGHPVTVTGKAEGGSRFTVSLPLEADFPRSDMPRSPVSAGTPLLLIEDDPLSSVSIRTLVEGWGGDIRVASSARQAISLIKIGFRPCAILADYRLPGCNGFEAIEKVRVALSSEVPALLVADELPASVEDEATRLGIRIVRKPVVATALLELLDVTLVR
jgi:CheY-like chemotaxis protein